MNGAALLAPLTGIGQYTFHLGTCLQDDPEVDLQLFYATHFSKSLKAVSASRGAAYGVARRIARRLVPHRYELARYLQQRTFTRGGRPHAFQLYHEPNILAYRFNGPSVITVHDLSWIRYPQTHPAERVRAMDRYFEPGLRRASMLITDAEAVRQEVIAQFGVDPDRIVAIPLGFDAAFRPHTPADTAAAMATHGLTHGAYFLSVGTLEPRKNVETTLHAYQALPASVRERHPLVLAGMRGWRTSRMEKLLEPLVSSGQVRVLGYLDRNELAAVTAGALAMVYPSLYEGFGLPPLEAMACGVPAIVSNVSSLPEVVGDTGLLLDPMDVHGLTEAMRRMAEDGPMRADLGARALARSSGFSWDRCAAATKDVYRRALSNSR
jgi:alpha-1,3-rhamnosyl/mannosyltransferase